MGNRAGFKRPHEQLDVWREAMTLVELVYGVSSHFPDQERYGLTAQMRRAAVSIPSNVAEGAARRSTLEYQRDLSIARGSLSELDARLQIAARLKYCDMPDAVSELIDALFAKLTALMNSLSQRSIKG